MFDFGRVKIKKSIKVVVYIKHKKSLPGKTGTFKKWRVLEI